MSQSTLTNYHETCVIWRWSPKATFRDSQVRPSMASSPTHGQLPCFGIGHCHYVCIHRNPTDHSPTVNNSKKIMAQKNVNLHLIFSVCMPSPGRLGRHKVKSWHICLSLLATESVSWVFYAYTRKIRSYSWDQMKYNFQTGRIDLKLHFIPMTSPYYNVYFC